MSDLSREARRKMRAKAHRLTQPTQGPVDASDYGPEMNLDADIKTGMRPVSRSARKSGGKVEGADAPKNAGKMARAKRADGGSLRDQFMQTASLGKDVNLGGVSYKRAEGSRDVVRRDSHASRGEQSSLHGKTGKWYVDHKGRALPQWAEKAGPVAPRTARASGGSVAKDIANVDMKAVNESREGKKHDGGLKRGGRADGGEVPTTRFNMGPVSGSRMTQAAGLKRGGKAFEGSAKDKREDKILAKERGESLKKWEASAEDRKHDAQRSMKGLEREKRKSGGGNWIAGAIKHPGALHRELHVPADKKIPHKKLEAAEHSKNPLERKRAQLAETLGRMHRKSGGRTGKTNISIVIGRSAPAAQPGMPGMPPAPNAAPMPVPVGPPGLGAAGPALPVPPPGPGAAGGPPPMMPPMARRSGGRTMHGGAEGGLARLEKAAIAKKDRER